MSKAQIHIDSANLAATAQWLETRLAGQAPIGKDTLTMQQYLVQRVVDLVTSGRVGEMASNAGAGVIDVLCIYDAVWAKFVMDEGVQYEGVRDRLQLRPGLFVERAITRQDIGAVMTREVTIDDAQARMLLMTVSLLCYLE